MISMMGNALQVLALLVALVAAFCLIGGVKLRREGLVNVGYLLVFGNALALTGCIAIILTCLLTENYSLAYVVSNYPVTDSALKPLYQVSAVWAGRQGSLLLWTWLISLYAAVVAWRRMRTTDDLSSVALGVTEIIVALFTATLVLSESNNPFMATAAEYLKRASDLGNTKAMCNLGSIMMGIDPAQALALFERAAEAGYEKGMINAATMLRGGNGVAANPERAVMWLERAASTSTEAAGILAHILRTGEGVFPDKPRAAELYRRAAEAGDPDSQYDLAMMLDAGDGIPVDREEAERWFRASADQGDNDARLCIGGILYERGEFAEAEGYFTDAALDGDVKAMYNLALMLMDGSLGERDENKAMEWMEMASDAGFVYAQSMLGSMLIDRDIGRAETLLRSASDAGEPTAMYNLGALALSGRIEMPDRDARQVSTSAVTPSVPPSRSTTGPASGLRTETGKR